MKTTMDRAGRLVIPKRVREEAGWKSGVELDIDYRDGVVVVEPVCKVKLVWRGSLLVGTVPGAPKMTVAQSNRLIRRHRDGQF